MATTTPSTNEIPAELLKRVQRPKTDDKGKVVTQKKGDETVPVLRAIAPEEVFAWREYPDRVVVVTVDGQKYAAAK